MIGELDIDDLKFGSLLSDLVKLYSSYFIFTDVLNFSPIVSKLLDDLLLNDFSIAGKIKFKEREILTLKTLKSKINNDFNQPSILHESTSGLSNTGMFRS